MRDGTSETPSSSLRPSRPAASSAPPTAPAAGQPSSAPTFITSPPGMPSAMKWATETPASAA